MYGLIKIIPLNSSVFRTAFGLKSLSHFMYSFSGPCDPESQYFIILLRTALCGNGMNPHVASWSVFSLFSVSRRLGWAFLLLFLFCSPLARSLLLVQFEDSEEDFDSRFDTDDELSYRRDSVYSCVTLPYFHSFLYMKGRIRVTRVSGLGVEQWKTEVFTEGHQEHHSPFPLPLLGVRSS